MQFFNELVEIFSVMMELEKGPLGLFFELNYFTGIVLSIYNTWFLYCYERPIAPTGSEDQKLIKFLEKISIGTGDLQGDYDIMYGWLYFNWVYLFISMVISLSVFFIFYTINNKLGVKEQNKFHEKTGKVH